MDKRAKIIIFKDRKKIKETRVLKKNFRYKLLERRAELLENEYEEVLTQIEREDNDLQS